MQQFKKSLSGKNVKFDYLCYNLSKALLFLRNNYLSSGELDGCPLRYTITVISASTPPVRV